VGAGKTPQTVSRLGRCLPASFGQSRSVEGKHFKQVVFAMLLGEEKPGPVCSEFSGPDQSADRAVSFRHMDPRRFVVLFPCYARQSVLPKRDESGHEVSLRMLPVQL